MADNEDEGIALAAEDPAVMKDYDDTYLSELTEKTSLENGDIFLVRGTDNQDYKIKLAGQVDSKINGALANFSNLYIPSVTDANECILTSRGVKSWRVYGSNTPTSATYFVTTYYTSETQKRITQIAYLTSGNSTATPTQYMRYGTSTDNINWNWGKWEKVVTESETPIIKGIYTDCNTCYEIPKTDGLKVGYYSANTNSPDSNYGWIIETKVQKSNTNYFGTQLATRNGGVPLMYIRTISFNTSGVATSFGKWRKITLDES